MSFPLHRSLPGRRAVLAVAGVALSAVLSLPPSAARADEPPKAVVEGFYRTLVDVMKDGPKLGFDGRVQRIRPAFDKAFNAPLMTRMVVGASWPSIPKDTQDKLVEAFTRYSVANYASNFRAYDGEVLEVIGEQTVSAGTTVTTHIVPRGEAAVPINYLLRPAGGGAWRIADVYLDGTISELATRRSDFARTMQEQGAPGLIERLEAKTKEMAGVK